MFQLIHEHSKCFFLLDFNQLCVEVYDNTCDDRNDKNSVNREQDGTDLSNQCDGNNVAKSGGRDDGVTIPQRITIAVDIRFDKPVPAAIRELEKIVWIIVCTANMHINQIQRETNLLQIPHWMRSGFVKDRNLHFIMISGMIGCSQSRCKKSVKFRGILSLALLSQKVGFNSIQTGMKMSLTKNNVMLTSGES